MPYGIAIVRPQMELENEPKLKTLKLELLWKTTKAGFGYAKRV